MSEEQMSGSVPEWDTADRMRKALRVADIGVSEIADYLGRVIPVTPELASILLALPHRRGPVVRRGDGQGGHNTPNGISKLGNRHLHDLEIPDTMHSLRHRYLTEACRIGGVRQAQELAGHSTPAVTGVYTKVLTSDLRPTALQIGRFIGRAS